MWAFILKRVGGRETFRRSKKVEWWSLVESKRTFKGWESGWYQSWRRGLRDASPSRERGVGGPSLLIQWFPWEIEKLDHFRLFPDGARPIRLTSFTLLSLSCYSNGLPLPSHQTDGALIHSPKSHTLSTSTGITWATFYSTFFLYLNYRVLW